MKKLITIKKHSHELLVSDCCGAYPQVITENGPDTKDLEICPKCKEHALYVTETEFETQIETPCKTN